MKKRMKGPGIFAAAIMLYLPAARNGAEVREEKLFFAAEQKGVVCGFGEVTLTPRLREGREMLAISEERVSFVSLLGVEFTAHFRTECVVDPGSGRLLSFENEVVQGRTTMGTSIEVSDLDIRYTSKPSGASKTIALEKGLVLENSYFYPYLLSDLRQRNQRRKQYRVFDLNSGTIQEKRYDKKSVTPLSMAGKSFTALVVDEVNRTTGAKVRLWLDRASGWLLKAEYPRRTIFRTEAATKAKLAYVVMDEGFFVPVNKAITYPAAVSYMKIKAVLEPEGTWITENSLNVPGQRFSGHVKDNLVSGVFTIQWPKYDGRTAPPFPSKRPGNPEVNRFLGVEEMIEANDPVITRQAKEITAGARDSWDAAVRLCRWVADNIAYDLVGGASARDTLDKKLGECGAHSLLLAGLCRAVGIPARVVWGCMYVPDRGGQIGQHAWNEVWMGRAGWIPIDSTTHEIDYVDSSHLRLAVLSSKNSRYNPKKIEILEFRAEGPHASQAAIPQLYQPFLGEYTASYDEFVNVPFKVMFRNGGLAVDMPGRTVYELKDPDPDGNWVFKVTDQLSISFCRDESGRVTGMDMAMRVLLPREGGEEAAAAAPEKLRPYLGRYPVPMEGKTLTILCQGEDLALHDPDVGVMPLEGPDRQGRWSRSRSSDLFSFQRDAAGKVTAMVVWLNRTLPRGKPAAIAVEAALNSGGIAAALARYRELQSNNPEKLFFSEASFNVLGYKLLGANQAAEAIAIFNLNVETYPNSANAWDSLAEACMKGGDVERAIAHYEKSLALDPGNANGRKMLEKLRAMKRAPFPQSAERDGTKR